MVKHCRTGESSTHKVGDMPRRGISRAQLPPTRVQASAQDRGHCNFNRPDIRREPVFIYALVEPDWDCVRYIGRSVSPKSRYSCHLTSNDGSVYLFRWIRTLRAAGARPRLKILSRVPPGEDSAAAEADAIEEHLRQGHLLLNRRRRGESRPARLRTDRRAFEDAARLGLSWARSSLWRGQ